MDGKDDKSRYANGWSLHRLSAAKNPPVFVPAAIYAVGFLIACFLVVAGFMAIWKFALKAAAGDVEAAKIFFPALVAIIGGPILVWRTITAHWSAVAAREQANTSKEAHYTGLFTKAAEQLGATRERKKGESVITEPNTEIRLGAIYALERIAHDSERDHWPIMEVLCAYIRQNSPRSAAFPGRKPKVDEKSVADLEDEEEKYKNGYQEWAAKLPELRADVQAALTVIGRRPKKRREMEREKAADPDSPGEYRLDLRGVDFRLADFRSLNFERALFSRSQFNQALFQGCCLDHANFRAADLRGARFNGCTLKSITISSAIADFADFAAVQFLSVNFWGTSFFGAVANRVKFLECNFGNSDWRFANCFKASLIDSQSWSAKFYRADMEASLFTSGDYSTSDFAAVDLRDSLLIGVDLSETTGLEQVQIDLVYKGDGETKIPERLNRPASWPPNNVRGEELDALISERDKVNDERMPF